MRGVKGLNDASNSLAYPSVFVSPASRLNYTREKEKREREREREIDGSIAGGSGVLERARSNFRLKYARTCGQR